VADVDTTIAACVNESSHEEKVRQLEQLLDRLRYTESTADDRVIEYASNRLAFAYLHYHEEAILDAVDATSKEGGYATYFEKFYRDVSKDREFLDRCRQNPEAYEAFRVGAMLSEKELRYIFEKAGK
jgi:hypothetical protein